jgi:WD40 repeat protein
LTRLTEITNIFQDDALKKIYSMSFSPDCALLAAVGHNGRATVFGASGTSTGDVLMSFKAHKGWVASTMFLNSHLLLTAANDAVVTIWDLRKVLASGSNQRPRIVGTNSTLHNNGIFCADVKDGKLVTASKDKTVSYCTIGEQEGIVPIRWFETLHSGVIKNVSLRDVNVLASTGNDCDVCVCDARQTEKNGLVQRIEDVHVLSTNHVSWNPSNANVLLTASFGNTIKLWDLRKTGAGPVHGMKGHSMLYDGQRGDIYHPLFVGNGQYIVTPGTKSNALTIFDTTTGEIVSKGVTSVGGVTSLASCDVMGSRLAACKRGNVVLLDPVWS